MSRTKYTIDMLHGALLPKILLFALPLILSGCLQLAFNAADVIVVGRFVGEQALAAVGSTSSLINLLINLFIGVSIGANVVMAQRWGAEDYRSVSKTIHTAITLSVMFGLFLVAVGLFLAKPLLKLMGSPEDVIDLSVLYLRLYFIGMPATMVYNFGSALLRAVGDTRRPLYYLTIAGCINVPLNLFFVIVCRMSVAGVAIATVISQVVSALLVLRCLIRMQGPCHLDMHKLKVDRTSMVQMMRIGVPAGIQSCLFSISNVTIQSSINSFGSAVMAGSAASSSIEGFAYTAMNSCHQATVSFTSQNYGAEKYHRLTRITLCSMLLSMALGLLVSLIAFQFGEMLIGIYSSVPIVIGYGMDRLSIMCKYYFLCGMMEILVGSMRGMGYSIAPMITSLIGVCAFRVFWVAVVFPLHRTPECLYWSYPISWFLTILGQLACLIFVRIRLKKRLQSQP